MSDFYKDDLASSHTFNFFDKRTNDNESPAPAPHTLPSSGQLFLLSCQEKGSILVSQLLQSSGEDTRFSLTALLVPNIFRLSIDDLGCRVMQAAIAHADLDSLALIVASIQGAGAEGIVAMAMDKNANHVLQRLLSHTPVQDLEPLQYQFLADALVLDVVDLARHRYGCRVVQKFLQKESLPVEGPAKSLVLDRLLSCEPAEMDRLIRDQFGNYSIQCCLEHGRAVDRSRIIRDYLVPSVALGAGTSRVNISCDKYASNVLEKALQFGSDTDCELLISALLLGGASLCPAARAMRDQYGNYVIQQCLKLDPSLVGVRGLRDLVLSGSADLLRSKYGWHLVHRARLMAQHSPSGRKMVQEYGVDALLSPTPTAGAGGG